MTTTGDPQLPWQAQASYPGHGILGQDSLGRWWASIGGLHYGPGTEGAARVKLGLPPELKVTCAHCGATTYYVGAEPTSNIEAGS